MSGFFNASVRGCSLMLLALFAHGATARTVVTSGCPQFHCVAGATGIENQPLIPAVLASNGNSSLGTLVRQGCSGNETTLTCLFSIDKARGAARGTLKQLDATTLQPIWGSAGASRSYNLTTSAASYGQVPVNFTDGTIAAGDSSFEVLYSSTGVALGKVALDGIGKNLGLTPIASNFGVVSQSDGVLTLVNLTTWSAVATLTLSDPTDAAPVVLVAQSAGASNVLYSIGYDSANNTGVLFSVGLTGSNPQRLALRSTFTFTGSSATCPVVVSAAQSGLPGNLVLVAVPGLPGDAPPQNRLMAFTDSPSLAPQWSIPLGFGLTVSPTVDQGTQTLFYQDANGPNVYQSRLLDGTPVSTFDLQTLGGFSGTFLLNGHVGAAQSGSVFTLLLAGQATTQSGTAEYVMAFQPVAMPNALVWAQQIASQQVNYTGAWNFAAASAAGTACPIAITVDAVASSIVRLCDH